MGLLSARASRSAVSFSFLTSLEARHFAKLEALWFRHFARANPPSVVRHNRIPTLGRLQCLSCASLLVVSRNCSRAQRVGSGDRSLGASLMAQADVYASQKILSDAHLKNLAPLRSLSIHKSKNAACTRGPAPFCSCDASTSPTCKRSWANRSLGTILLTGQHRSKTKVPH